MKTIGPATATPPILARRLTARSPRTLSDSTRAGLDLVERHVLVGAVGDAHVAGAEDHAGRPAVVDEHLHIGAVRLPEQLRAPTGHPFHDRRQPDRQGVI